MGKKINKCYSIKIQTYYKVNKQKTTKKQTKKKPLRDFPGPGAKVRTPNAGGLGLTPGQGTSAHML